MEHEAKTHFKMRHTQLENGSCKSFAPTEIIGSFAYDRRDTPIIDRDLFMQFVYVETHVTYYLSDRSIDFCNSKPLNFFRLILNVWTAQNEMLFVEIVQGSKGLTSIQITWTTYRD
jgi:hypothetical protein